MQTKKIKNFNNYLILFLFIFLGGLILSGVAFYNGYPMITPDSKEYISGGFTNAVKWMKRPIEYGYFVYVFSLAQSLWYVVIAQSTILSYLIFRLFRMFLKSKNNALFLAIIFFLVLYTGVSWYASQIMADIFTSIAFLSVLILLFYKTKNHVELILLSILLLFSILTHNSHYPLFTVLLVLSAVFFFTIKWFRRRVIKNQFIIVAAIIVGAWLMGPFINFIISKNFTMNTHGHVFISGRLLENGILEQVLEDECKKPNNDLCFCKYQGEFPSYRGNYIWTKKSPLRKCGGWYKMEEELNYLIKQSFTKPRYIAWHIKSVFTNTMRQLTQFKIGYLLNQNKEAEPRLKEYFEHEFKEYKVARQGSFKLDWGASNKRQATVMIITVFALLYLFARNLVKKMDKRDLAVLIMIATFLILDAGLPSSLSGVSQRYFGKVIWLLPFYTIFIGIKYRVMIYSDFKQIFSKGKNSESSKTDG
ncbi:MAG: hypothetical protein K9I94_09115 [Bacteroidales bacterium]|nr:hypothetical protein [Bacteroidales bacterium]